MADSLAFRSDEVYWSSPTVTHGGGIDPRAVVGSPPEDRTWSPGEPVHAPEVHASARVEAFVTIDGGTRRPTRVGEGAWLFKHVHAGHDVHVGAFAEVATGTVLGGFCEVGEHAHIGIGAVVLPYRRIGARAQVGAGAVVTRDVPPGVTVVGNPARILRDEERDPRPHSERASAKPARFDSRNVICNGLERRQYGRPIGKSYGIRVELLNDTASLWNPSLVRGQRAFLYPEQAEYLIALGSARRVVEGNCGEVRPRSTLRWRIRRRVFGWVRA